MSVHTSRQWVSGAQVDGTEREGPTRHGGKYKAITGIGISVPSREVKVNQHSESRFVRINHEIVDAYIAMKDASLLVQFMMSCKI